MIQHKPLYYDRRFLDAEPTHSTASIVAAAEAVCGTVKISDGQNTVTLDFFYNTEEERQLALRKLEAIQEVVNEFSSAIRLRRASDRHEEVRLTP